MFIDASVIVALLLREPGYEELEKRLADAGGPLSISPLVIFEASTSLAWQKSPKGKPSAELLHQAHKAVKAFVDDVSADEMAISPDIGSIAIDASATYGKLTGHPANLNFGDCFAYACAKTLRVPLLYKGNDFALTDLA